MNSPPVSISHYHNPAADRSLPYPASLREIISLEQARSAVAEIAGWPGYAPTPLVELEQMAHESGLGNIYYKDEARRFQLKSFKALGGAFAVARQLIRRIREQTGENAGIDDLLAGAYPSITRQSIFSCATDGNHGRSVAWGCKLFGCSCIIYIHRDVSAGRQQAMEKFGAEVIRIDGNYDDSVRTAAEQAEIHGRTIISDTSYPGYMDIPRDVMLGYTVMLAEAVEQLDGKIPTHVFIQGGVGGLAAAVCAYFWETWGERRPRLVVVEPEAANCLQQSARAGRPETVEGDLETLMAGLACGEVSLLAWDILQRGADDFVTLSENAVAPCMIRLAADEARLEAGESGIAGIAAAIGAAADPELSAALGLDKHSRVFVIGTEGATDPEVYQRLVGAA